MLHELNQLGTLPMASVARIAELRYILLLIACMQGASGKLPAPSVSSAHGDAPPTTPVAAFATALAVRLCWPRRSGTQLCPVRTCTTPSLRSRRAIPWRKDCPTCRASDTGFVDEVVGWLCEEGIPHRRVIRQCVGLTAHPAVRACA